MIKNFKITDPISHKSPADTTVIVAMSGGVDSSVVAALLHDSGYKVIGVTMQLYDHGQALKKSGACCAGQDIYDAKRVAEQMGFPHYVLDYESQFKQDVIDDFADSYARGETPIPCVRCNQTVKFRDLVKITKELKGDALITGHYIKRREIQGKSQLHRANDHGKDQSYFLFATTQDQLDMVRFPLGDYDKSQIREWANHYGLTVADKPESMDICFVAGGNYADIVTKLRPESADPGNIVHVDGRILGTHKGIIHYTVGQRRGIGVGGTNQPLYVIKLNPEKREVIVGEKIHLSKQIIHCKEVNWIGDDDKIVQGHVKFRSVQSPFPAKISVKNDTATVEFYEPQYGISAGQACVFYDDTRVLGGGWIYNPT